MPEASPLRSTLRLAGVGVGLLWHEDRRLPQEEVVSFLIEPYASKDL